MALFYPTAAPPCLGDGRADRRAKVGFPPHLGLELSPELPARRIGLTVPLMYQHHVTNCSNANLDGISYRKMKAVMCARRVIMVPLYQHHVTNCSNANLDGIRYRRMKPFMKRMLKGHNGKLPDVS
ncbi:hypothetical protein E2562_034526 [Oryza meyeriana var. granulata]|uniref:Uncharacterized protein n=1 Tax=Oryza meyeriana var. granulata TaxID=110450 RepID=A0A6G1CAT7_9ORYZ|nr:hypothetical protein E2562_034526 [Oryza meyeriana var. granulata]